MKKLKQKSNNNNNNNNFTLRNDEVSLCDTQVAYSCPYITHSLPTEFEKH